MTEQEPSVNPGQRPTGSDRLAQARRQLAGATAEFQKALAAVRDPGRRQELTSSYIALLQKSLAAAQQSLDRYGRRQAARRPGSTVTDDAAADLTDPQSQA